MIELTKSEFLFNLQFQVNLYFPFVASSTTTQSTIRTSATVASSTTSQSTIRTSATEATTNDGSSVTGSVKNKILVPVFNESFPYQKGWLKKMVELRVTYKIIIPDK